MDMSTNEVQQLHPCQKCGACCAAYRVIFYWREAEPSEREHPVPTDFWVENGNDLSPFRVMKGTNQNHKIKCEALIGKVGKNVSCLIYQNRPSPCHNFKASYENNIHQPRCDQARAKHGLAPLTKQDWICYSENNFSIL